MSSIEVAADAFPDGRHHSTALGETLELGEGSDVSYAVPPGFGLSLALDSSTGPLPPSSGNSLWPPEEVLNHGGDTSEMPVTLNIKPLLCVNFAGSAPSALLKVLVTINGKTNLALVDTGASHSLITGSCVGSLNVDIDRSATYKIFGIAEENGVLSPGKAHLNLCVGDLQLQPHDFLVVETNQLPVPLILGADFLKRNNMEVTIGKRLLIWRQGRTCVEIYVDGEGVPELQVLRSVPCFAASTVKIRAGTTETVPVTWTPPLASEEQLLLFDGSQSGCKKNLGGITGIVQAVSGAANLLFSADARQSGTIKKGAFIFTLEAVVTLPDDDVQLGSSARWTRTALQEASKLNGELTGHQQDEVHQILWELRDVMSTGDDDVGHAGVTAHRIELYHDTPIYQRPRRFPPPIAEEIERQCHELHNLGIIEPSASPYSSPVVPVRKKDGSIRLCVDYRALNKVTKPDKFPIPNLTDSIYGLKGVKYFTKLDLVWGYYQVPLDEASREFTAFSTPHGHWQFNRLSFGLKNAPSAFQREMQAVLCNFRW